MSTIHSSNRLRHGLLVLASAAVVGLGAVDQAAHAEGVMQAGFVGAAANLSGGSLVDTLGDTQLLGSMRVEDAVRTGHMTIRQMAPRERSELAAGVDLFARSRLVLPLVIQSAVGKSIDSELAASKMQPMTGPMVGLHPHPATWGSTLAR